MSYEGDTPADCARRLADAGADIVGVNCLNGPEQQLPIALEMREAVGGFVATQPVAYRTTPEAARLHRVAETSPTSWIRCS